MYAPLRFLVRLTAGVAIFSFGMAAGAASTAVGLRILISKARLHRADPANDELLLVGVGHPVTLASEAQRFRGGTLINIGGGFSIDFTPAALDRSGGRLVVVTVGGDTAITVPEQWDVRVAERGREDGETERTPDAGTSQPDAPRLEIEVLNLGGSTVVKQSGIDGDAPGVELFRREANARD